MRGILSSSIRQLSSSDRGVGGSLGNGPPSAFLSGKFCGQAGLFGLVFGRARVQMAGLPVFCECSVRAVETGSQNGLLEARGYCREGYGSELDDVVWRQEAGHFTQLGMVVCVSALSFHGGRHFFFILRSEFAKYQRNRLREIKRT